MKLLNKLFANYLALSVSRMVSHSRWHIRRINVASVCHIGLIHETALLGHFVANPTNLTIRMPKCVRWLHKQTVLLLLDSGLTSQPSLFQPPVRSNGDKWILYEYCKSIRTASYGTVLMLKQWPNKSFILPSFWRLKSQNTQRRFESLWRTDRYIKMC